MERLTLEGLDAEARRFDEAVARTPDIDRFCSSSDWVLPAARAIMEPAEPFVLRGAHGYVALTAQSQPPERGSSARVLRPLEAAWGLACPFVGADPEALVGEATGPLLSDRSWRALLVCGVARGSRLEGALVRALGDATEPRRGPETVRCLIDLRGGLEPFLARRSDNFRRSLARAERDATRAGLGIETASATDETGALAAYERLLAVEARSWKTRDGGGLANDEMRAFYRLMVPRLARRGALRLRFARLDGEDVGYILGGLFGAAEATVYRGLQFSFDRALNRLSIGNLLQLAELRALAVEGVGTYDLGTDREYKRRWCDALFSTETLVLVRRTMRSGDVSR